MLHFNRQHFLFDFSFFAGSARWPFPGYARRQLANQQRPLLAVTGNDPLRQMN
jgi:hypothetical protein